MIHKHSRTRCKDTHYYFYSAHFFEKKQRILYLSEKYRIFAAEKRMIMAKPIEPTPVLKGDDAYEFVAEMEKQKKVLSRRTVQAVVS